MGVGHYGRGCTEHFLVGVKGKPKSFTGFGLRDIPNVILEPRTQHSRKPEKFFAIANRLGDALGGSKIELFARSRREGWDAWGADVNPYHYRASKSDDDPHPPLSRAKDWYQRGKRVH